MTNIRCCKQPAVVHTCLIKPFCEEIPGGVAGHRVVNLVVDVRNHIRRNSWLLGRFKDQSGDHQHSGQHHCEHSPIAHQRCSVSRTEVMLKVSDHASESSGSPFSSSSESTYANSPSREASGSIVLRTRDVSYSRPATDT